MGRLFRRGDARFVYMRLFVCLSVSAFWDRVGRRRACAQEARAALRVLTGHIQLTGYFLFSTNSQLTAILVGTGGNRTIHQ
ncbi:hypothetical protein [Pandoravirus japonicus]|uniref:Uncharacterized protein n=1 Tax=Pandoravirus japonicus TaxID=2823154 RepID=A0A811BRD6_9VIRU|nr:hypothetical protein [Pandoravirus japonicus]